MKHERLCKIDKTIGKITKGLSYVSGICLLVMALWATINVISQKVTHVSIPSTNDWIAYLMIPVVFLAAPFEIGERGLTAVDFCIDHLPKLVQKMIVGAGYLLGAFISVFVATNQFALTKTYFEAGKMSSVDALNFPLWPFSLLLGIGCVLMTFCMLWYYVKYLFMPERLRSEEDDIKEITEEAKL